LTFVNFLLEKDGGLAILKQNGQLPVVPTISKSFDQIPGPLRRYAKKEKN